MPVTDGNMPRALKDIPIGNPLWSPVSLPDSQPMVRFYREGQNCFQNQERQSKYGHVLSNAGSQQEEKNHKHNSTGIWEQQFSWFQWRQTKSSSFFFSHTQTQGHTQGHTLQIGRRALRRLCTMASVQLCLSEMELTGLEGLLTCSLLPSALHSSVVLYHHRDLPLLPPGGSDASS